MHNFSKFVRSQINCMLVGYGNLFNLLVNIEKTSPKGFSTSKCDKGNQIFSKSLDLFEKLFGNFWDFFGIFLWFFFEKFFGGFFWEKFLKVILWEDFFERIFLGRNFFGGSLWEEFFVSVFLVWEKIREENKGQLVSVRLACEAVEMTWDDLKWLKMTWNNLKWLVITWHDLWPAWGPA